MSIFNTVMSQSLRTIMVVLVLHVLFLVVVPGCERSSSPPTAPTPAPSPRIVIPDLTIAEIEKVLSTYEFPKGNRSQPGLLIIGLDGFSLTRMQDMIRAGELPVLAKLMSTSAWGKLQSTIIPSSVVAWTSAFTGQLPERHGMTSFFTIREDGLLGLINSRYRTRKAIWDYLVESERFSVIMNIPGTYPPDPVRGIAVSGLLTPPGEKFTFPPDLTEYLQRLSYYTSIKPLNQVARLGVSPFEKNELTLDIDQVFTISYNQAKVGLFLFERVKPDLFITVFTLPDRLQHSLHLLPEQIITEAYHNFDTIVGHFLSHKPADVSLIMLSDHGFKEYRKAFFPNKWLQDAGFLTISEGNVVLKESKIITIDTVGNYVTFRFNVLGRDRYGKIPPEHIDSLYSDVEKGLLSIVSPLDKKHIINRVIRFALNEVPDYNYTVDMVAELDPEYMVIPVLNAPRSILSLSPPIFDHERDGFFLINSTYIKAGFSETLTTIPDITPMALYLLNCSIPKDIDGRLLEELIYPDSREAHPPEYSSINTERRFSGEPENRVPNQEIMNFLRSLGYTQ